MNSPSMNASVATATKRNEVFKGIVALCAADSSPLTVNVMNVQVFFSAAILASMAVALQGFEPVAAKIVIVFSALAVFGNLVFIGPKPIMDAAHLQRILTRGAAFLWAGPVLKIVAAIITKQNSADRYRTLLAAKIAKCLNVFLGTVGGHTGSASLLVAPSRLVISPTYDAFTILESTSRLPVSGQGARLATLCVGGGLDNFLQAIGALNRSICSHISTPVKFFRNITRSCKYV